MLTAKVGFPVPRVLSRLSSALRPRRLPGIPELEALSLARSVAGARLTVICVLAVLAVTVLESARPGLASLGSLLFIPVLASAWLLDRRAAVIVSSSAVAARVVGYTIAGVDIGTAIAEVVTLGSLAIMTSVAAQAVADARTRDAQIAQHQRELELLEERERIALTVTDTAIRRLFALSLKLQAMSTVLRERDLQPALNDAIAETDRLAADFRDLIFKPERVPQP